VRGGDDASPRGSIPVEAPTSRSVRLASLTDEDRQALYATSLVLDNARRTAFVDEARRNELRETVRYDELVDRLGDVMAKLRRRNGDRRARARRHGAHRAGRRGSAHLARDPAGSRAPRTGTVDRDDERHEMRSRTPPRRA
jgi:hypothetical protein